MFRFGYLGKALKNRWPFGRPRGIPWLPLGITARLTISFAAVAILAAAANLIAERGVSIVHTTRLTPASQGIPQNSMPARTALPIAAERSEAARLGLAVDRFERAVRNRAAVDSPETQSKLRRAALELDLANKAARTQAGLAPVADGNGDTIRVEAYKKSGERYLQLADARRRTLREHAELLDAMSDQIDQSLDHAWHIFGHVLTRQSLMRLRSEIDALHRRFASISIADAYDNTAVDAVAEKEATIGHMLEGGTAGLARTEGQEWMASMRKQLASSIELRRQLVDIDQQRWEIGRHLAEQADRMASSITPASAPPVSHPPAKPLPRATSLPIDRSRAAPTALPLSNPVVADMTTTTVDAGNGERRALVAWITAGVLTLLLAISFFTVRSVLVPVRNMLRVTSQLAGGGTTARVPRGGIRELDTLGIALNRMADQIVAANQAMHDYQHQLEVKVEDRTRRLQHLAAHDSLTGLPNRRELFVLLNDAIVHARTANRSVGVFFIDIDNFKNLNDSMGHAFGDRVLISIAQRLQESARRFGFAARLGGDEFTVVYENAPSANAIHEAGWALVRAFSSPLVVDNRELIVSVSVGASLYPDHDAEAEALLSAADAALFQAKALGRSQLAMFTPELLQTATNKFTTEQGLRRAIERSEFELVYQPEISLDTMEIGLVEALIRWRLPDGRLLSPGEFLAVAEESGLIIEIGDWVLRTAIANAARWHHGEWPDARVAINVSARQLLDRHFVDRLQDLLIEFQLPARCVEIELTETVLQTDPSTIESLRRLRAADIAVALDDFGTGYSSLTSLAHLPITRVKLDRSLIAGVDTSARSAAISRAIISLCNSLGLAVTAEGIERPEQLAFVLGNRSMQVQGFLFSKPIAGDQLLEVRNGISSLMSDLLLSIPAREDAAVVADIALTRSGALRNRRHT